MSIETESAREYFKKQGLSYKDIGSKEISILVNLIKDQLKQHDLEMKVKKPKFKFNDDGGLLSCFIRVKSFYFDDREAISFNTNGFIGFAGWSSSANEKPFVTAFYEWIKLITNASHSTFSASTK